MRRGLLAASLLVLVSCGGRGGGPAARPLAAENGALPLIGTFTSSDDNAPVQPQSAGM